MSNYIGGVLELPIWLIFIVVVGLFILSIKGIAVTYKGFHINTRSKDSRSIPMTHVMQFRNLKSAIKFDVDRTHTTYQTSFNSLFLDAFLETGADDIHHPEILEYRILIREVLDIVFLPDVKRIIYANHFPKRKVDSNGEYIEPESEFRDRFKSEFTINKMEGILKNSVGYVRKNWEIKSVSRIVFEREYIRSVENITFIENELNDLFLACQKRKIDIFNVIADTDRIRFCELEKEWDMIYG